MDADVAAIAALLGDHARARMMMALMGGRSLTATELSRVASVTKQTASSHLAKLQRARLVIAEAVGRHRFFRLADHDVGEVMERLVTVAERAGAVRVETGPADPALRRARVCYDHLAGDLGVHVFDSLVQQEHLRVEGRDVSLTEPGEAFCRRLGIDVTSLRRARRPLCLACLDWSVRRRHLAGALGAALLRRFVDLGWARQQRHTRVVLFSALGERALRERFRLRTQSVRGQSTRSAG